MLDDLSKEAANTGLELHPDKTHILYNGNRGSRKEKAPSHATANGMTIETCRLTGRRNILEGNCKSANSTSPSWRTGSRRHGESSLLCELN
eukprot:6710858-Pyramimonas_sp.AAC.1